jgi:cytoskeleton protein RodZ
MTEAVLTGVGQELAAAREARGLALADVAQQLKFAPRQLEALEREHFAALPGATFARGMVRSYARLLKLDPEPLLQRIADRFEVPDSSQLAARYHQPVPFSDSARRSTFVYLGMSLGVLVLVGAVAWQWHQERTAAAKKSTAVARAAPKPAAREANCEAAPAPAAVRDFGACAGAAAVKEKAIAAAPAKARRGAQVGFHRLVVAPTARRGSRSGIRPTACSCPR